MSDTLQFAEDGFELYDSLAKMMDEGMEEAAAGTALGLTAGGVIGAAAFVVAMIKFMTDDGDQEMVQALKTLQRQIDEIRDVLVMLDNRIDELVDQVAIDSNRQTMRDLQDYLDTIRQLDIEMLDRPMDADTAVRVANEAGILCDKFLRSDYEIWRWMDIVRKPYLNQATGETTWQNAVARDRFKNMPTLPVYAAGLLVWLGAREKARRAGQGHRLVDDHARLERHRDATAIRAQFDKYSTDPEQSTPHSLPEHIKARIRAYPVASDRHANNRICRFYFDAGNMMTGSRKSGDPFDMVMPPGIVLCTLDPGQLGTPSIELDMELAAGVETLRELTDLLARLANGDSLRGQFIGVFPTTEVFVPAVLYVIDEHGHLQWYCNESAAARGGSKHWQGPKRIDSGWGGFIGAFGAGGPALYGIQADGTLYWCGHDGHLDGSPAWRFARPVGSGWQDFKTVFSGGDYIIYAIHPDGRLLWYRHDGAGQGTPQWTGPVQLGTGWQSYEKVFSGGDGVVYAIRSDGVLERRKHLGYLDGSSNWGPMEEIGTGWSGFRDVVAAADGVLYAFTRDGRVLWYRYGKRPPLPQQPQEDSGGLLQGPQDLDLVVAGAGGGVGSVSSGGFAGLRSRYNPNVVTRDDPGHIEVVTRPEEDLSQYLNPDAELWEGPVESRRNFPAFRRVFVRMAEPYRGPN